MKKDKIKILKLFILFILACILIYFSNSLNVQASTLIPSSDVKSIYYYMFDETYINQYNKGGYNNYMIISEENGYSTGTYLGSETIEFSGQTFSKSNTYTFKVVVGYSVSSNSNCFTTTILRNWNNMDSIYAVVGTTVNWNNNITYNINSITTKGDLCSSGTITLDIEIVSKIDFNGLRISWGDTVTHTQLSPLLGSSYYDAMSFWLEELRYDYDATISDSLQGVEEKLNDLKNQGEETNEKLNDIEDTIKDSDISDANSKANDFFNNFKSDDFGLSDIITLPLSTIKSITSKSCQPLNLTAPFVNYNFNLPCMNEIYSKFEPFYSLYQSISFGIISYWICVKIYALVKGFKNPDEDKIEVMDL